MKPYNGHRSYNAWNVSLWIGNDEGTYRFAMDCLRGPFPKPRTLESATTEFMSVFKGERTPDGVLYTRTNVRLALAGLRS